VPPASASRLNEGQGWRWVDFQGSRVTSDGGLIVVRELDERLGLGDLIVQHLTDSRRGKNTQLPLADLLRFPVLGFSGGATTAPCGEKTAPRGANATRRMKGWRLGVY